MKKKSPKNKTLKYITYSLLIVIFSLISFISGIYLGEASATKKQKDTNFSTVTTLKNEIKNLEAQLSKNKKNTLPLKENNSSNMCNITKEKIIPPSEIADYESSNIINKPKNKTKTTKVFKTNKPKLVIILDDVSFNYQVKGIKKIPFKITPSFFPPTKVHPNTPIYAKEFSAYMVHVPMQAINYPHPEPHTINTNWSYTQIKNRINYIHKIFPNAKFINNHTGSKFTANLTEMKKLFKVLKQDNLGFVDSRTTHYSKAKKAEKIYHIPFYERGIFLDNKPDITYIQNQLKKAVKLAKKRGYAIAIGHPHPATIQALKKSQNILKNVDVITINELYQLTWKK